jgi:hypothetical protein
MHAASHTLYPPQHTCLNAECTRSGDQKLVLKKAEQRQAVLFTMDGVFPAWSVHLYCTGDPYFLSESLLYAIMIMFTLDCNINYHHNFYVEGGERVYYDTIPEIIQVGEHQFVEQRVINMFITLMLVSWYVLSLHVWVLT